MACSGRLQAQINQRWGAGLLSAALHCSVAFIVLFSGDRHEGIHSGDTPTTKLVLIEAPDAHASEGIELQPVEPSQAFPHIEEPLLAAIEVARTPPRDTPSTPPAPLERVVPIEQPRQQAEATSPPTVEATIALAISESEQNELSERLVKLAEELATATPQRIAWQQDGKHYSAVLVLQRANDGMALDRVIAEVSAADRGKQLLTRVALKRLPFSSFSHVVDRWDPMVQFHDDEIDGRVHTNTSFNLQYDRRTAPEFLGKVTTAAGTFHTESKGRRRQSEIFKAGVQTRAKRIRLPEALQPFEWAPHDERAQVYEYASDTSITFLPEGGFTWHTPGESAGKIDPSPDRLMYVIARPGVTLRVRGVLAGKALIYSPHKIVIEGSLTYARDPRESSDSPDYLGLVCDRYIEIAPPSVTGPGDLQIDAAIFAGRRFVVTNINHRRSGTLRVFGSLSAGSMSASEPRYATKIEYDKRFEEQRPPGFPSTDRFEVAQWDREWTEIPEHSAADAVVSAE